ncbi:hypothetical protein H257_09264 [Aphanomyces astaci]|uniref:Uncharacterized protein n=1 Tax=Aphanomyces astaci TaxID=112090 RepID=W4GBZ8_APHAT|nr:hypothetical protein H257_09264 [Aphanomyces astaci]ETV76816.1 hypothetical protein H257_09264 [Aphanomyces astaci]|eukprot:XP_009833728.1 hypothetical protein H257_09264 [Aphanomyces astaci]
MDQEPCEEPSPASDMSSAAHAALDDGRLPHIATPKDVTGTVSPTASTIASSPVVARDAKEVHEEPPCKKQRLDAEEVTVDSLLSMSNPLTRPLPSEQNVAMPTTGTIPPPPLDNALQATAQPITRTMPIPSPADISPTPHSPVAIVDKPPQSASLSPMLQPHSVVSTDLTEHIAASTSSYSSSELPCDTSTNEVASVVVAPLPSIFDTCDVLPSTTPFIPSFAPKDTDSRTLSAPSILDPACHPTSPPPPPTTTVDTELPALGATIDVSPSSQAPCVGVDTSLTVPAGATAFVSLAPGPPASDPSATSMQHDTLDGGAMTLPHPKLALLHPKLALLNPKLALLHPKLALLHPKLTLPHPKLTLLHPKLALLNPKLALLHPKLALLNPKVTLPHPKLALLHPKLALLVRQISFLWREGG